MSRKTYSPGAQRMHRLLHELFRGSDWKTILAAVGFLALMQCAATDAHHLAQDYLDSQVPSWLVPATGFISIVLLFVYIWLLRRLASQAPGGKLDIHVEAPASPCKGLIVFLSLIRNDPSKPDSDSVVDSLGLAPLGESLKDELVRARLQGPWRMPVEAIAHHDDSLLCVVVIFSSTVEERNPDGSLNASPYVRFRAMVTRLTKYREKPLETLPVLLDNATDGINFNDPHQVLAALEQAKKILLEDKRLRPEDIVIDITSGTKVASGIAAAAAFDDRVRVQYVEFNRERSTYTVAAYDLSYIPYAK